MKQLRKIYLRYDHFKCSTTRFSFSTKLNFSHVNPFCLAKGCMILPNLSEGLLGWAPNRVSDNTGGKLSIKFGGSQRAQDVIDKMTPALLPKFTNSKIKIGTIVTVSQDFSNLSGIWNGQLLNKHEGADKIFLRLDQKKFMGNLKFFCYE